jgi:hypothetical protein
LKKKYIEYVESKFAPGGKGYLKAKQDFEERVKEQNIEKQSGSKRQSGKIRNEIKKD